MRVRKNLLGISKAREFGKDLDFLEKSSVEYNGIWEIATLSRN